MRIARPILLVSTPIGVIFGLREAWRLAGPKMALLMAAMLTVVGLLVWWTVQRIRQESASASVDEPQPRETQHDADAVRKV